MLSGAALAYILSDMNFDLCALLLIIQFLT